MAGPYTIARPYAEAIFELAQEQGRFEEWESELALLAAISEDATMGRLLQNPRLDPERKEAIFFGIVGDRLEESAHRLLKALFANDRVQFLPAILELFQELRREAEGEVRAEVVSAYPLAPETKEAITAALEHRLGKRVYMESRVDSSLIAGLVIRAGDWTIDGSVQGGLEQLRQELTA